MEFRLRKLPVGAASTLRSCPVSSVRPYVAMPAPVYVYFPRNEKFVAVKAPLDFFTPEELGKWGSLEMFFLPETVDRTLVFREAAVQVRSILAWKPSGADESTPEREPAPYEVSDAILRILGKLWCPLGNNYPELKGKAGIESFFVAIFATEFCDGLPAEMLRAERDRDVDCYDRSIIFSSWMVFLALLLGYFELSFLNTVRTASFQGTSTLASAGLPTEIVRLAAFLERALGQSSHRVLTIEMLADGGEPVVEKLKSRLARVQGGLMNRYFFAPSMYGETGFLDE
jgi:hypothetical protein